MKLEVGKFYKARNGAKVEVTAPRFSVKFLKSDAVPHPFTCDVSASGEFLDGRYNEYDIVEEWQESQAMKLEVGKSYKTVKGKRVDVVYKHHKGLYCFVGYLEGFLTADSWAEDGKAHHTLPSMHDIISEWQEPKQPESSE